MPPIVPVVEAAKNLGYVLAAAAIAHVAYDSLSKTADPVDLKTKLELREARLMAIVVATLEPLLVPFLRSDMVAVQQDVAVAFGYEETTPPVVASLSDSAKDAIGAGLRRCDTIMAEIHKLRCLPERVSRLNQRIYSMSVALAVASVILSLVCLLFSDMPRSVAWAILATLITLTAVTLRFTVARQRLVHDATQAIVAEDPQPRA